MHFRIIIPFLMSVFASAPVFAAGETVNAWITTTTSAWVERGLEPIEQAVFAPVAQDSAIVIKVDEKIRYQQWEGAGASFTDGAAWLMNKVVKPEIRDSVMTMIFDPDKGMGVSFLRNPMGSSDLTVARYTYDDVAEDLYDSTLPNFTIAKDREDVIPMTKLARKLNPGLTLMMNTWSPPAWMKSNNSVVGGEILPRCYPHHANYYLNTIKAYEAESLHIDYVSLNNEPTCCQGIDYPSVWVMGADAMRTMLKSHWLPMFEREKVTTRILLLDFNYGFTELVTPFLADPAIKYSPHIGGVAFHGYDPGETMQTTIYDEYGYDIQFTEYSGFGDGREQHERDMRKMVAVLRNFSKSYVKWPVASDEQHGPHVGGCSGCRGLVRVWRYDAQKKGNVDYRIDLYDIGHITKFVKNGAFRIFSTGNNQLLNVAFQNADKSIALLVYNDTLTEKTVCIQWGSQSFRYTVPSKASITFKWAPAVSVFNTPGPRLFSGNFLVTRTLGGFSIQLPSHARYSVELIDMGGRAISKKNITGATAFVDARRFGRGMYMVRVSDGRASFERKCLWMAGH